ncbi:MAG: hypothetical protein LAT65_16605 [Saccharospirillum sp.]|nr:hypothetical protein [Saccharospirillum sp.]
MSLHIDQLNVTLPASLKGRTGAIQRLLRRELSILNWPSGDWPALQPPDTSMSHNATNLAIARSLARQLHQSAWQRANGQIKAGQNWPNEEGTQP